MLGVDKAYVLEASWKIIKKSQYKHQTTDGGKVIVTDHGDRGRHVSATLAEVYLLFLREMAKQEQLNLRKKESSLEMRQNETKTPTC